MSQVLLDDVELQQIQSDCAEAIENTTWKYNANLSNCTMIKQAIQLAREGFDGGPEALQIFKPKSRVFSEWMDYAHLLTVCYNYDKEVKKFTILRNRILFQAPAKNSVSGLYIAYTTYVSMIHIYYLNYYSIYIIGSTFPRLSNPGRDRTFLSTAE